MWYANAELIHIQEDRVSVVLKNEKGEYWGHAAVPSKYFPINGKPEVFYCLNTVPITHDDLIAAFDSVPHHPGWCFEDAGKLLTAFENIGIKLTTYVGWRFQHKNQIPEHMCWLIYEKDGQKSLLDLDDDQNIVDAFIKEYLDGDENNWADAPNEKFLELQRRLDVPNSQRCAPVGVPSKSFFYVGCPCSLEKGLEIRNKLKEKFPEHISITGLWNKPE